MTLTKFFFNLALVARVNAYMASSLHKKWMWRHGQAIWTNDPAVRWDEDDTGHPKWLAIEPKSLFKLCILLSLAGVVQLAVFKNVLKHINIDMAPMGIFRYWAKIQIPINQHVFANYKVLQFTEHTQSSKNSTTGSGPLLWSVPVK